jgi:hypothetical protein
LHGQRRALSALPELVRRTVEWDRIKAMASLSGRPASAWIRIQALLAARRRQPTP